MVAIDTDIQGHSEVERILREGVDVVCGGFPCQDISTAGRGAGLAGERSGLWREMLQTIRLVRPRYAIVENVAALLSRGMGTVLGDLAESGYDTEWDCISAFDVGAPHLRRRIWVVAYPSRPDDRGNAGEICEENGRPKRDLLPESGGAGEIPSILANAKGNIERRLPQREDEALTRSIIDGEDVPDPASIRQPRQGESIFWGCRKAIREGQANLPESKCVGSIWRIEPDVGRVVDGVPMRMDRLSGLGNAVVPQIPEIIGSVIMELSA